MRPNVAGRYPTTGRRHRGFCELASGGFRFLLKKRDVIRDGGCRDQPRAALGDRSEAAGTNLFVDGAAAQREDNLSVADPVELRCRRRSNLAVVVHLEYHSPSIGLVCCQGPVDTDSQPGPACPECSRARAADAAARSAPGVLWAMPV